MHPYVTIPAVLQQAGRYELPEELSSTLCRLQPGMRQVRHGVLSVDAAGQPLHPVRSLWTGVGCPAARLQQGGICGSSGSFYILDNLIDQPSPVHQGNANKPSGAGAVLRADRRFVIEGNRQYDVRHQPRGGTRLRTASTTVASAPSLFSFVAFAPTLYGEYIGKPIELGRHPSHDCSSPRFGFPPPVEGYGMAISHTRSLSDGLHGGAIALTEVGTAGPPPATWDLSDKHPGLCKYHQRCLRSAIRP